MKTKRYLTIAAVLLTSSLSAFATNTDKIPGATVQDAAFFTGKPYDADLESYVFNYRSYNAEMGRWTTSDPSGFPDGANNSVYLSNSVLNAVDSSGLVRITAHGSFNVSATWTENYVSGRAFQGFSIALPPQISVPVNPAAGWAAIGRATLHTSGTRPEDAELPEALVLAGWSWVDNSIVQPAEGSSIDLHATYGATYDFQLAGFPGGGISESRRDGSISGTVKWTRIYEE